MPGVAHRPPGGGAPDRYREGYFERPRRSDGEAIADSLGISSPTFHQHRRVAIDRLLGALFDD